MQKIITTAELIWISLRTYWNHYCSLSRPKESISPALFLMTSRTRPDRPTESHWHVRECMHKSYNWFRIYGTICQRMLLPPEKYCRLLHRYMQCLLNKSSFSNQDHVQIYKINVLLGSANICSVLTTTVCVRICIPMWLEKINWNLYVRKARTTGRPQVVILLLFKEDGLVVWKREPLEVRITVALGFPTMFNKLKDHSVYLTCECMTSNKGILVTMRSSPQSLQKYGREWM